MEMNVALAASAALAGAIRHYRRHGLPSDITFVLKRPKMDTV